MNVARFCQPLWELDTYYVWSDFLTDQLDADWVDTVTDSGTVLMGDAVGGVAVLTPSDGTIADNDEAYLTCPNEVFKYAANKPIYGACSLQFTEGNTDDANIAFFFMNAAVANSIIDDGGGLKVSGSTLGIYKVDGETVWRCVSSVNGVSNVTVSTTTAGGSAYQKLEIIANERDSSTLTVSYKCDGDYLKDSNGLVIRHTLAIANATEMMVGTGIKLGAANGTELLSVDYLYASQRR